MDVLENFRAAYHLFERELLRTLRIQVGDVRRLDVIRSRALSFQQAVQQHIGVFPPQERATLLDNLAQMVRMIDTAQHDSLDPADDDLLRPVQHVSSGGRGRPRVDINPHILRYALELRSVSALANFFGCSRRTVRRRALEYGFVDPAPPVQNRVVQEDGTTDLEYVSYIPAMADISDDRLDELIRGTFELFPSLGRQMIIGHLLFMGYRVSKARIRDSYIRINGLPPEFGRRRVERRVYRVAGPNSLCHHDGWHGALIDCMIIGYAMFCSHDIGQGGLIKFGMVIHMFVDGDSRFIKALGVHNNNRADTVLDLFLAGVRETGLPSRCRGDHGGENIAVARFMEEHRGDRRNPYIWGRSVHNIRCERCWYDLNQGFGMKWKDFFYDLEMFHDFVPTIGSHIWLLHHLFLPCVRADAERWRQTWNYHKMQLKGERDQSPREMFFFRTLTQGPRGIEFAEEPVLEDVIDPTTYGVDWEEYNDERLMDNFTAANSDDREAGLLPHRPESLSVIDVLPPHCPLTSGEIELFRAHLGLRADLGNESMLARRATWTTALELCEELIEGRRDDTRLQDFLNRNLLE